MDNLYSIYGLINPDTESIVYVGRSKNPQTRLDTHLHSARMPDRGWRVPAPLIFWLRQLRAENKRPGLEILEKDIEALEEAERREDYWIDYSLAEGCQLLNVNRNYGPKLDHEEYYTEARERMAAYAAPIFLARQSPGTPYVWAGEPRWLREYLFYYIRNHYSKRSPEQRLYDALNNFDFSALPLEKLERIVEVINEQA